MEKLIKISFLVAASLTLTFAQAADSTRAPEAKGLNQRAIASTQPINLPTDVKPKQPTNWSKIKDLFL
jgi:hypothetical protein